MLSMSRGMTLDWRLFFLRPPFPLFPLRREAAERRLLPLRPLQVTGNRV